MNAKDPETPDRIQRLSWDCLWEGCNQKLESFVPHPSPFQYDLSSDLQLPHVTVYFQPHRETDFTPLWFTAQVHEEGNLIGSARLRCPHLTAGCV